MLEVTQMRVGKLAVFAYILADRKNRVCALIDPAFQVRDILDLVREKGLSVSHVVNTHHHSDHTAGNRAAVRETGAALCIHREDAKKLGRILNRSVNRILGGAGSPPPDLLLSHGDRIHVGDCELDVIHTPGHTPGGICIFCENNLFTGDTLFAGSVGRTDLPGGSERILLESIQKRLYTLHDDVVVWPGHDYGSLPSSTIGREKATNPFTRQS